MSWRTACWKMWGDMVTGWTELGTVLGRCQACGGVPHVLGQADQAMQVLNSPTHQLGREEDLEGNFQLNTCGYHPASSEWSTAQLLVDLGPS